MLNESYNSFFDLFSDDLNTIILTLNYPFL